MKKTVGKSAPLRVRLLGELAVFRQDKPLELPPSKKARALLAYLVATQRPQLREHLCTLLWDGPDDPRAQLRWSLTKLRPVLDGDKIQRLQADRERVTFLPGDAEIDLEIVRGLGRRGFAEAKTAELAAAAESFTGAFIEGLDLSSCHRFHAWCVALREELHALHVGLRTTLIDRLRTSPEQALHHARALLGLDPLAESSHITVVRLLGQLGRAREALEQYERCRQLLERELGTRPSREMEEARMVLGKGTTAAAVPPMPAPIVAAAMPASMAQASPRSPPLVGRRRECEVLQQMLAVAASGKGRAVVLVAGEPGIGKSRLLDELVAMTMSAGGRVLSGRAFEAELVRPYGVWVDVLRSGGALVTEAGTRASLAPLLPELGQAGSGGAPEDRNHLFEAVAEFVTSLAREHGPLLIVLDDLQWLDDVSAALLHFVARAVESQPILIACAARGGEIGDNPAVLRLVRTLDRERRLRQLTLSPLDAQATALLVDSVGSGIDASVVFEECEGNPLFAIEMARSRHADEPGVSSTLTALIGERLDRLDDKARSLLPFAAALGHTFDPDVLARVVGMPAGELLDAFAELERRGVFRGTMGGTYDFSHDLIRQAAYQQMSEPRRRMVHLRIGRAILAASDADGALAGEVAHHAGLGGDSECAAKAYLAAAQRGLRLFAWGEVAQLARLGIQHIGGLPRSQRLEIHVELLGAEIFARPSRHRASELKQELVPVLAEAEEAGLAALVARGYYLGSVLQFRNEDAKGAEDASRRAVAAGRSGDVVTSARSKAESARCLMLLEREIGTAKAFLAEATAVLADRDDFILDWALGLMARYTGDTQSAAQRLKKATMEARRAQSHWEENECLRSLVLLALESGDIPQARQSCPAMLEVAGKMGEGSERPIAEALAALVRLLDDDEAAEAAFDRAMDAVRAADAKAMLSTLLNFAAEYDLGRGRHDRAESRANEALAAAATVERRNQVAIAQAILSRAALARGDRAAAATSLEAARVDVDVPLVLSVHARRAVERALEDFAG